MIVAVASENFKTVTAHAGKTRHFLLFEAETGQPPREIGRLDLPETMTIHAFASDAPHPLDQVQTVIAGSAGEGFVRRMQARGIVTALTDETDPVNAVVCYLAGQVAPVAPEDVGACGCNDEH